MPRKTLLFAFLLAISVYGFAQDKLVVTGIPGDFYTTHIVTEKESLYSIGRTYLIAPKQIANYNRINLNDILPLGYKLRIPLNPTNFLSSKANDNDIPIYHIAQKGENLYRLSQRYNKVKINLLREWNDLKTDNVRNGQAIIVGYIPYPKLVQAGTADPNQVFVKPPVVTKPSDPSQKPLDHPNVLDAKKDGSREVKGEMKPLTDDQIMALREAEFKAKRDAEESLDKMPPVISGPLPKDPPTEFKTPESDLSYSPKQNDEGYFALLFPANDGTKQFKSDAGTASTFKTNSGLIDRKFYVLMNDVLPGTIVRVVAPNNKSICARVLGALPTIKNSPSLLLRMSAPAAAALGMKDTSFYGNYQLRAIVCMNFFDILTYSGTFVFAITGATKARTQQMDIFGGAVLAFATAYGGGTIRDLLIGIRPVNWINDYIALALVFSAVVITFLIKGSIHQYKRMIFITDAIGLGLFTAAGISISLQHGVNAVYALIMGIISATFGGVIADILRNEVPDLLKRGELYATACFMGGTVFLVGRPHILNEKLNLGICVCVIVIIRVISKYKRLTLPQI